MSLYAFYEQYFPFWKALKEEDKNYLCENTAEEHFDKEQPVHDNMGCSGLFIVRSGRLRLYMLSENGKEITLYRLFERDMCLFSASCMMRSIQFEITIEAEVFGSEGFESSKSDFKIYEKSAKDGSTKEVPKESLVTGQTTRKATITGNIQEEDIKILEAKYDAYKLNPENPPYMPTLFTSWGRGDFQKGIDEILMAIKAGAKNNTENLAINDYALKKEVDSLYLKAYAQKELGNEEAYKEALDKAVRKEKELGVMPKPIFAICAGLDGDSDDIKRIRTLISELSTMPELKGQFAYIDGFGPGA